MQLLGDVEKIAGDGLVLLLQFLTDGSNPMNRLADAVMDVPIRDALGQFCQTSVRWRSNSVVTLFSAIRFSSRSTSAAAPV